MSFYEIPRQFLNIINCMFVLFDIASIFTVVDGADSHIQRVV